MEPKNKKYDEKVVLKNNGRTIDITGCFNSLI